VSKLHKFSSMEILGKFEKGRYRPAARRYFIYQAVLFSYQLHIIPVLLCDSHGYSAEPLKIAIKRLRDYDSLSQTSLHRFLVWRRPRDQAAGSRTNLEDVNFIHRLSMKILTCPENGVKVDPALSPTELCNSQLVQVVNRFKSETE
jgi:hypothetical protein